MDMLVRLAGWSLVVWLLAAALSVGAALAKDLYVGPGGEYESISDAVDAAGLGDRIIVRDGEYRENVWTNPFSPRNNVVIMAENPHEVKLIGELLVQSGSGVIVDGFSVVLEGACTTLCAINTNGTGHAVLNAGDITVSGTASWSGAAIGM